MLDLASAFLFDLHVLQHVPAAIPQTGAPVKIARSTGVRFAPAAPFTIALAATTAAPKAVAATTAVTATAATEAPRAGKTTPAVTAGKTTVAATAAATTTSTNNRERKAGQRR